MGSSNFIIRKHEVEKRVVYQKCESKRPTCKKTPTRRMIKTTYKHYPTTIECMSCGEEWSVDE